MLKQDKGQKILPIALVLLAAIILFTSGYVLGYLRKTDLKSDEALKVIIDRTAHPQTISFNLFWNVWDILKEKYVTQPVAEQDLLYGAISGIVASLNDPYSVFLEPELTQKFSEEITGTFEGIGAELGIKDEQLVIIAPLPDTPASKAGLEAGDKILAINGLDTAGITVDYAVNLIRGEAGTEVVLTILKGNETEAQEIKIIRDKIKIASVTWEMKGDTAYIKISHFNNDTGTRFAEISQELLLKSPQGLILDLRNNPGGYLDRAISIASKFIEDGPVVLEKFADGTIKKYNAEGQANLKNLRTIVLINEGSASAAEIIAGALQDYGLAQVIGEKSFGKGSVQDWQAFSDGSSLKLTVAYWLTPQERSIEGNGITPDVEIEMTKEDYEAGRDPQLDKALELLK